MTRRPPPYAELVALARRHARRGAEAEDIVQEVLIAAVAAGRADFSLAPNRRWIAGAIRKRAAFDARSASRRRAREARWTAERAEGVPASEGEDISVQEVLIDLPPSLRVVAALALSGHSRKEIGYLLGVSDAALRQRIRALKLHLEKHAIPMPKAMSGLNLDLAYGAIRQALAPALARHGGVFASHDPDGHLFIVSSSSQKH